MTVSANVNRPANWFLPAVVIICLAGCACAKRSTEETVTTEANRSLADRARVVFISPPVQFHRPDTIELLGDRLAALAFLIQTGRRDVSLHSLMEIEAQTRDCLATATDSAHLTALRHTLEAEIECDRLIRRGDPAGARTQCRRAVTELDVILSRSR